MPDTVVLLIGLFLGAGESFAYPRTTPYEPRVDLYDEARPDQFWQWTSDGPMLWGRLAMFDDLDDVRYFWEVIAPGWTYGPPERFTWDGWTATEWRGWAIGQHTWAWDRAIRHANYWRERPNRYTSYDDFPSECASTITCCADDSRGSRYGCAYRGCSTREAIERWHAGVRSSSTHWHDRATALIDNVNLIVPAAGIIAGICSIVYRG